LSHLLAYLGIEIEAEPVPEPPMPQPVIKRNGKLQTEFMLWYRAHGNSWGALKRGFEGDPIDTSGLGEEGQRLAKILAACNTEQRKRLRGYVRAAVGGVFES